MWQDDIRAKDTKLPWVTQENYDAGNYNDTSGDTATNYCENTLKLGGYSDWRLPNINELKSIVDRNKYNPAIVNGFENTTGADFYFSSTTSKNNSDNAFVVGFYGGSVHNGNKGNSTFVRCVRAGE